MGTVISALPCAIDLVLYQGDDFNLTLTVTDADGNPVDYTGYIAACQIRETPPALDVLAELVATITGNVIALHLPAAESALIAVARATWDVQVSSPGGVVTTLAAGRVAIAPEVTRP